MPSRISLFTRLVLVFLATAIGLLLIAINTFQYVADEKPDRIVPLQLLRGVAEKIPAGPEDTGAMELVRSIVGNFVVLGDEPGRWSDSAATAIDDLPDCDWTHSADYEIHDKTVLLKHADRCVAFLDLALPLSDSGRNYLIAGIIGSAIILVLAYAVIYRLFYPVHALNEGVNRIASGEISYRLKPRGRDELGELIGNVNVMAERIEAMLAAKNALLLDVSHELRSPLAQARVFAEMIENPKLKDRLCRSLDKLGELVSTLLDAERLKHNRDILRQESVDVDLILRDLIATSGTDRIRYSASGDDFTMKADEVRFSLMLKNIISNALTYSDTAPVPVSLRSDQGRMVVEIEDSGPGIAPELLEKLGSAFYRPDSSRTRKTGGFGLGIYLARLIANAHGGDLDIRSETGKGTTVVITVKKD